MKKKDYYIYKMDLAYLNVLSIVLLFGLLIFNQYVVKYNLFNKIFEMDNLFDLVFFYFIYTLIHELLHSFSYVLNGAKFKKVVFGVMLEKGILYCLCKQNISKKNILCSLLTPFFVIGVFTYIIGVYFDIPLLVMLSILNISGCSGDLVMFSFISRLKNIEFTEFDDATSFALYSSEDLSKYKHKGLKYVGKRDSVLRKDMNKIVISRVSLAIILFMFVLLFF